MQPDPSVHNPTSPIPSAKITINTKIDSIKVALQAKYLNFEKSAKIGIPAWAAILKAYLMGI